MEQTRPTDEPLALPHLAHDLRLVRRYAFVYSDAPFQYKVPVIGALLNRLAGAARSILRGVASLGLGSQAEFNTAVADILFEFTRRASTSTPLTLDQAALDQLLERLNAGSMQDQADALRILGREIQLLRDEARAAQLSATESERAIAELRRELEMYKRGQNTKPAPDS